MKDLSFKNYPTKILVSIICIIIAGSFACQIIWKALFTGKNMTLFQQLACIATSSGLVLLILGYINKYAMWKWYLKLLDHCDIRGLYEGVLITSFHENDNPAFPHIKLYAKVEIVQNLNGFRVNGKFFTDKNYSAPSSGSSSTNGEIRKEENGCFHVYYFFSNKGNPLHTDQALYGINNHDGVCVLLFDPATRKLEGYYYTHERASYGNISLWPAL